MKRKLLSLAAALLCAVGVSAYTTSDLTSAGWASVTNSLPTPLSDYYFVFVDNGGSLMLDYATGSLNQGTDKKTMYYRTNADPIANPTMVWILADNTAASGAYSIKNVTEPKYYLQEEYNWSNYSEEPWFCHTNDNGGGAGVDKDWCAYNIVYDDDDGKWTIQTYRVNERNDSYVGPWNNSNFTDGAEVAGNKAGNDKGYFQIYAIKRSKAKNLNFTASKISNPSFESELTGWVNSGMQKQTNSDFAKTGSIYAEAWQPDGTKSISQTISGLPAGQYCLSAHCKARGVTSAKIFAGSNETPITIEDSDADYYVYFTNDGSSSVNIGFEGVGTGAGASWIAVDNFQLKYYGTKVEESADMPSNGSMAANGWYSLIIPTAGSYNIKSTSDATIYYTQDGSTALDGGSPLAFTAGEQKSLSLSAGNLFIKSSVSQVVDVDTRFYLITTVNDERKWLNKNASGITYAYDRGLSFKLESRNGNAVFNFGNGNYLNDVGSSWQTKAEGSNNNEWKVEPVEGGYKLLLGVDNRCQLVVIDTTTGLVEMTRYTDDGNVWQFIQPQTALSYAITDAETHTLGFDNGEYAPYNNVEAVTALATARAASTNDARISAYTALTDATWTANAAEVNAVYDGNFSIQDEHTTPPTSLTGWVAVDGIRQLIKNTTTYPGLTASTASAGAFSWGGTALTYGNTEGYTLPLAAHTIYELTLKITGWSDGDLPTWLSASVLKSSDGMATMNILATSVTKRITEADPFVTCSVKFVTGEAGDYVLVLQPNKHNVITDITLFKADNQYLVFADGSVPNYAPGTYPKVKINRTLTATRWATAVYPFAVSKSTDIKIATLSSYDASTGTVGFATPDASNANEPFLMRSTEGKTEIELDNVAVAATVAEPVVTKSDASSSVSLKGTYSATTVGAGGEGVTNYVLSSNVIYPIVDKSATLNPYRAYIQIGPSSGSVKALNFFIDDEEISTGIVSPLGETEEGASIYNVAGQRLNKMQKGINIVNGKKIMK